MAQSTSDTKPEIPGIGVDKAWTDAAIASVAVNERQLCFAHLPCLLHELMKPAAFDNLGWMKSVKVYLHTHSPGLLFGKHSAGHRDDQILQPGLVTSAANPVSNGFQTNLVVDCFS